MDSLEINGVADGLLAYLKNTSDHPRDALAILGITLIKLYDISEWSEPVTFPAFAKDFHDMLIESEKNKKEFTPSPAGLQ